MFHILNLLYCRCLLLMLFWDQMPFWVSKRTTWRLRDCKCTLIRKRLQWHIFALIIPYTGSVRKLFPTTGSNLSAISSCSQVGIFWVKNPVAGHACVNSNGYSSVTPTAFRTVFKCSRSATETFPLFFNAVNVSAKISGALPWKEGRRFFPANSTPAIKRPTFISVGSSFAFKASCISQYGCSPLNARSA